MELNEFSTDTQDFIRRKLADLGWSGPAVFGYDPQWKLHYFEFTRGDGMRVKSFFREDQRA